MSIGPNKKEIEVVTVDKMTHIGKEYFKDPSYYLFYITLSATIAGLFCGMTFSIFYYSIIVLLGLHQALRSYGNTNTRKSGVSGDEGRQYLRESKVDTKQPSSSHTRLSK